MMGARPTDRTWRNPSRGSVLIGSQVTTQRLAPEQRARLAKLQRLLARIGSRGVRSASRVAEPTPRQEPTAAASPKPTGAAASPKPTGATPRLPVVPPRVERPVPPSRPRPSPQLAPTPRPRAPLPAPAPVPTPASTRAPVPAFLPAAPIVSELDPIEEPGRVAPPVEEQLVTSHEAKVLDDLFADDHGESGEEQAVTRVVPVDQLLAESMATSHVPPTEARDLLAGQTSSSSAASDSRSGGGLDVPTREGASQREPAVVVADEAKASRPSTRPVGSPSPRVHLAVYLIAILIVAALAVADYRFFLPL